MFRGKRRLSERTIAGLYDAAAEGAERAHEVLLEKLREQGETPDPEACSYIRVELYVFYIHLLDWFAFGILGEPQRNLIADQIGRLGLAPFVQRYRPWGVAGSQRLQEINMLRSVVNRGSYYAEVDALFWEPEQRGEFGSVIVFGLEDVLLDDPQAKVSRLAKVMLAVLFLDMPGFGENSEVGRDGAKALGTDPRHAFYVFAFGLITAAVTEGLSRADLLGKLDVARQDIHPIH